MIGCFWGHKWDVHESWKMDTLEPGFFREDILYPVTRVRTRFRCRKCGALKTRVTRERT